MTTTKKNHLSHSDETTSPCQSQQTGLTFRKSAYKQRDGKIKTSYTIWRGFAYVGAVKTKAEAQRLAVNANHDPTAEEMMRGINQTLDRIRPR